VVHISDVSARPAACPIGMRGHARISRLSPPAAARAALAVGHPTFGEGFFARNATQSAD
jgi:hypothetical protein